jgi:hypothetical protein
MQINTKKKQVQEEDHDVGMLMPYVMNPVLDDKESKKNARKRVFIVEILVHLVSNGIFCKSM